jgi:hypothetical protein
MLQNLTLQSSLLHGEPGLPVISIPMVMVFSGLLVGSVSLVAGRLREVSEGVGNSVEEGAISAKRGGTGRAISSFTDRCLTSDQASQIFYQIKMPNSRSPTLSRLAFNVFDVSQTLDHSI